MCRITFFNCFLYIYIFTKSGVVLSDGANLETLKHCCSIGTKYASSGKACETFQTPISGVPKEQEKQCLQPLNVCCQNQYRISQCNLGQKDAAVGTCKNEDNVYRKECCEVCQLGIKSEDCRSSLGLGAPFDDAFVSCCKSNKPTTVKPKSSLSTNQRICDMGDMCTQTCEASEETYVCGCYDGFELMSDGVSCKPKKHKQGTRCEHNNPCDHKCLDTGTSIKCSCHEGFKLKYDGKTCEDIDECAMNIHDCPKDEECVNEPGGYACEVEESDLSCPIGYKFNGIKNTCDDIDECQFGIMCPRPKTCTNTIGSFVCEGEEREPCPRGYTFNVTIGDCTDIDECETGQNDCNRESQTCTNTKGNYTCVDKVSKNTCPAGFKKNFQTLECEDINECLEVPPVCKSDQECVNMHGEHTCIPKKLAAKNSSIQSVPCKPGYDWNGYGCYDIDECEKQIDTCDSSQNCINTPGSFKCACKIGFTEDFSTGACVDINECQMATNECTEAQRCDNTVGSYLCSRITGCGTGYTLNYASGICEDDDECQLKTDDCKLLGDNYKCRNILGSYRCEPIEQTPFININKKPVQSIDPKKVAFKPKYNYAKPTETTTPKQVPKQLPKYNPMASQSTTPKQVPSVPNYNFVTTTNPVTTKKVPIISDYNPAPVLPNYSPRYYYPTQGTTPKPVRFVPDYNVVTTTVSTTTKQVPFVPYKNPLLPNYGPVTPRPYYYYPQTTTPRNYYAQTSAPRNYYHIPTTTPRLVPFAPSYNYDTTTILPTTQKVSFPPVYESPYQRPYIPNLYNPIRTPISIFPTNRYVNATVPSITETNLPNIYYPLNPQKRPNPPNIYRTQQQNNVISGQLKQCLPGYKMNKYGKCEDINECESNPCPKGKNCVNYNGRYTCNAPMVCKRGFELDEDSGQCIDVNECTRGTHTCEETHICKNGPGYYVCECQPGFSQNRFSKRCEDIDECKQYRPCGQHSECINTPGSFECRCRGGFVKNGSSCADINECSDIQSLCDQKCINVWGGYRCGCLSGFQLSPDNRTCIDENECEIFKDKPICVHKCVNTPGSYECACPSGYKLGNDKRSCLDINECQQNICDNDVCLNIRGGYKCYQILCPPGYSKDPNYKTRCKRTCDGRNMECSLLPEQYNSQYIALSSNLPVIDPVQLFHIKGPQFIGTKAEFTLSLLEVNCPQNVQCITESFFKKEYEGNNNMKLYLVRETQGPQDVKLQIEMKLHQDNFQSTTVVYIYIAISEYSF